MPLKSVSLEGRTFPAPARPEVFLEAAYGPDWQIPNPAFEFHTPRPTKLRIGGWLGGLRHRRDDWSRFYDRRAKDVSFDPTPFARWVAERESSGYLIDMGCGNGRDSVFFAERGFEVLGLDFVRKAMKPGVQYAQEHELDASFDTCNLYSWRETLVAGARFARHPGRRTLYGRFLVHNLDQVALDNLWRYASMGLRGGGRCYLEFRTLRDRGRHKAFGARYRRFMAMDDVCKQAVAAGARVAEREAGTGLAPYGDEDPYVARLALEWK